MGSQTAARLRKMRESRLENELAQAEEVYDHLIQTRRSLGTMLAETIRKGNGRDLEEFKFHRRDLSQLIWQTDLTRTELRYQLLERRARQAEDEYRRATEESEKAARSHEQARKAYIKAQKAARRSGLEARRLAEVCDKEAEQLQELLRVPEDAQRYQLKHQRGEQRRDARRGPRMKALRLILARRLRRFLRLVLENPFTLALMPPPRRVGGLQ